MKRLIELSAGLLALMFGAQAAFADVFELASDNAGLIGAVRTVQARYDDTFVDLGRANGLGYEELRLANPGVDPWVPGEGTEIVLPSSFLLPATARKGIVVNIAEFRVYYFYSVDGKDYVATLPASVGRMDWETPLGAAAITAKVRNPSWYPPDSVRAEHEADGRTLPRVVPPGPDNPLGNYALRLSLPGYLIHGTNRPDGVGMRVTHGCIRLFPEDIEWLFPRVDLKTPVRIINQPLKFGWQDDALYLEVHPTLEANLENGEGPGMTLITSEYIKVTGEGEAEVDWELIARVYREKSGVPVRVGGRKALVSNLE